jgi:hypothetical protein
MSRLEQMQEFARTSLCSSVRNARMNETFRLANDQQMRNELAVRASG